jgi:hypothetical protein
MNKKQKESIKVISNLITGNLNSIYNTCEKTAKGFKKETISLGFLKIVIEKTKPRIVGEESIDKLVREYHKTLDQLYRVCESRSKMTYKTNDSIPLLSLKFYIERIKKAYKLELRQIQDYV